MLKSKLFIEYLLRSCLFFTDCEGNIGYPYNLHWIGFNFGSYLAFFRIGLTGIVQYFEDSYIYFF